MSKGNPLLSVRVDRQTHRRLKAHAADTGAEISDVLRTAITLYMAYEDVPDYAPEQLDGQQRIDAEPGA